MRDILSVSIYKSQKPNIFVESHKTGAIGNKSLKILGPQIWNSFPESMNLVTNLPNIKKF